MVVFACGRDSGNTRRASMRSAARPSPPFRCSFPGLLAPGRVPRPKMAVRSTTFGYLTETRAQQALNSGTPEKNVRDSGCSIHGEREGPGGFSCTVRVRCRPSLIGCGELSGAAIHLIWISPRHSIATTRQFSSRLRNIRRAKNIDMVTL